MWHLEGVACTGSGRPLALSGLLQSERKYFNIVDLCGILPYKRMCPHLCGRIIYNCISSPFSYYNQ